MSGPAKTECLRIIDDDFTAAAVAEYFRHVADRPNFIDEMVGRPKPPQPNSWQKMNRGRLSKKERRRG